MSILIKGMKMPRDEPLLVKINPDGTVSTTWKNGYKKYEAVELPAEHGRLIDGDIAEVITYTNESGDFADGILYAAGWIAQQPTVIEAENPFYESLKRGLEQALNGEVREITVTDVGVSDDA